VSLRLSATSPPSRGSSCGGEGLGNGGRSGGRQLTAALPLRFNWTHRPIGSSRELVARPGLATRVRTLTVLKTSHQSSARSRSHGVVLPQSCSASESARAVAKRSAGSFARQRINTASRSAGTVCPGADGEGGVDETTQNHIATECPQLPDREDNIGHRHARPLRTDRLRRWPEPAAISVTQLFSHEHWGNQRGSDGRRRLARHLLKSTLAES